MWGSDEVLKQFYLFRNMALNLPSNSSQEIGGELIIQFEQLLFSIRRDLGHKNNKLKKGTILGLFINDLEKLF
jgi:hypothetical protein